MKTQEGQGAIRCLTIGNSNFLASKITSASLPMASHSLKPTFSSSLHCKKVFFPLLAFVRAFLPSISFFHLSEPQLRERSLSLPPILFFLSALGVVAGQNLTVLWNLDCLRLCHHRWPCPCNCLSCLLLRTATAAAPSLSAPASSTFFSALLSASFFSAWLSASFFSAWLSGLLLLLLLLLRRPANKSQGRASLRCHVK